MDSKRDHRGGHRNIYDQIDLEIINSKGPGSEISVKFTLKISSKIECTPFNIFFPKRQIFISTFYSSSLKIKSEIMAHLEMPGIFFILHFGR